MSEPRGQLMQVGWYCWRCEGLVERPCRSDNVPISVPADWADDMLAEIRRLDEEPDGQPAHIDDGPTVREEAADEAAACNHSFPDPYPAPIDEIGDCRYCGTSYQAAKRDHDGPSVREAAANDRRWPLEKHGE